MLQTADPIPEQRHILRRVTSSLVDIVVAEKDPGYTSYRSTCPDGQFWLPVRGIQLVKGQKGQRQQRPFELMYYAPREPAVRVTDSPTLAYGVRLMLSGMTEEERDDSWFQGREMTWDAKRRIVGLIVNSLEGRADEHTLDEAVAQWVGRRQTAEDETSRAKWMARAMELLHENPSLSLIELSRAVGVVPCYLSAQFSRLQGCTVSAYRRQVMLDRAFQAAGQTGLNVAAIEAGFYDASHFHRACLAELGTKASDIRCLIWPT